MTSVANEGSPLIHDNPAVNKCKTSKRRYHFFNAITVNHSGQRFFKFLRGLGEEEQRNRLRRQECGVRQKRVGCWMKNCCLINPEREGLRNC